MSATGTPSMDRRTLEAMSLEELRREYVALKVDQHLLLSTSDTVQLKIESLRDESVRLQQSAEVEEEHAANQLFRRLDGAERDVRKYQLLLKEEESATNGLRLQIRAVRGQQSEVETQLEQQEEYLLLQLQKKLLEVATKKGDLERELQTERQRYLEVLVSQLAAIRGGGSSASAPDTPLQSAGSGDSGPTAASGSGSGASVVTHTDPVTHEKVQKLEDKLNALLAKHARAMHETAETERRCAELSAKLTDIQNATFLDRARAAKLKEELGVAREKLAELEATGGDTSSYDDSLALDTPRNMLDYSFASGSASMSLKERTKELLSAAPL